MAEKQSQTPPVEREREGMAKGAICAPLAPTSEGYLFKIRRDRHAPVKLLADLLLERLGGAELAVDHEGPLRGLLKAAEPREDFAVVGVGAQVLEGLDAGPDGDLYAVHL